MTACSDIIISDDLVLECQENYQFKLNLIRELEKDMDLAVLRVEQCLEARSSDGGMLPYVHVLDSIQKIIQAFEQKVDHLLHKWENQIPNHQQDSLSLEAWKDLVQEFKETIHQTDKLFQYPVNKNKKEYQELVAKCKSEFNRKYDYWRFEEAKIEDIANIEVQVLLAALKLSVLDKKLFYWEAVVEQFSSRCSWGFGVYCDHSYSFGVPMESIPLNPKKGELFQTELGVLYGWGECFLKQYTRTATSIIVDGETYYLDDENRLRFKLPRPKNGTLDSIIIEAKYEDRDGIYHHLVDTFYYQ